MMAFLFTDPGVRDLARRIPIDIGRDAARRAAQEELSTAPYLSAQQSLTERALRWVGERFTDLLERAAQVTPGGHRGLLGIAAALGVAAILGWLRLVPRHRKATGQSLLFVGRSLTAAEHRHNADRHGAAEAWAAAVRERLRAIILSLEERAIIEPGPGRTADEAAVAAGHVLPSCATELAEAARVFDGVVYGAMIATPAMDAQLRRVDSLVSAARPHSFVPTTAVGV
jgi:hypothetical protein